MDIFYSFESISNDSVLAVPLFYHKPLIRISVHVHTMLLLVNVFGQM